jgi:hypothetical protein
MGLALKKPEGVPGKSCMFNISLLLAYSLASRALEM